MLSLARRNSTGKTPAKKRGRRRRSGYWQQIEMVKSSHAGNGVFTNLIIFTGERERLGSGKEGKKCGVRKKGLL
jgi:hypothetical protein